MNPYLDDIIEKVNTDLLLNLFTLTAKLYDAFLPLPGNSNSFKSNEEKDNNYVLVCQFIRKMYLLLQKKHNNRTNKLKNAE